MNGFMPLVEAFLAFSLTMIALTTAVSVIVGLILRFLRSRAAGLREMMNYLYRNEIIDIVKNLVQEENRNNDELLTLEEILNSQIRRERRIEFLVDMTFLPTVVEGSENVREELIENAEAYSMILRWKAVKADEAVEKDLTVEAPRFMNFIKRTKDWPLGTGRPARWCGRMLYNFIGWFVIRNSLKYGLDTLKEDEFVTRLKNSRFGKALALLLDQQEFEKYLLDLKDQFISLGGAYSEKFTRKSRILTFIAGFLLAFSANVDSIALIESYMTSPELRNQVIMQQEKIMNPPEAEAKDSSEKTPDEKVENLDKTIDASLDALIEALPDEIKNSDAVQDRLKDIKESKKAIKETYEEASHTYAEIQRTVIGLTQNFPIGWSLYPNCYESDDPRCLRFKIKKPSNNDDKFPYFEVLRLDTGQYSTWFIGVFLTGLLLALGTPFWVQVATSFLRARNLIRGSGAEGGKTKTEDKKEETKEKTPKAPNTPATPPGPQTDIPSADTVGKRVLLK